MFDSQRFNGFVKKGLDDLLYNDIWDYWVFNESDLHSAAYFYIRRYFDKRGRDDVFVRCEPALRGSRPDIVIFQDTHPVYAMELKMFPEAGRITENLIYDDLEKLQRVARIETVKWAFFIVVCDLDESWKISDQTLRRRGYEKVSSITINLRRKETTERRRSGYDRWRAEFDRLRDGQRKS